MILYYKFLIIFCVYNILKKYKLYYHKSVIMFNLIEEINKDSIISIKGKKYHVIAMVKYVTEKETSNRYVKIQLENHFLLVIAPFDNCIYFGHVGTEYPCDFPTPNSIEYNGKIYLKDSEDYQIVKEFIFGNFLDMEGEVKYADFSCWDSLISLGIVSRTNKRSDVYANIITLKDISIIE